MGPDRYWIRLATCSRFRSQDGVDFARSASLDVLRIETLVLHFSWWTECLKINQAVHLSCQAHREVVWSIGLAKAAITEPPGFFQ